VGKIISDGVNIATRQQNTVYDVYLDTCCSQHCARIKSVKLMIEN